MEIAGDEYAYTSLTVADKEFNLSEGLSKDYSEDDAVYVQTVIRNVAVTGNATISGNATVSGTITDKNGNEVIAMQVETKQNTTGYTVAAGAEQVVPVAGFSFTPKAVWTAMVVYGAADNDEKVQVSYPGVVVNLDSVNFHLAIINGITFDTVNDEVDISIRNAEAVNAIYIEQVIVTASG